MPEIIESIGLEIETDSTYPGLETAAVGRFYTLTRDASCERDVTLLPSGIIMEQGSDKLLGRKGNRLVVGTEYVSAIIDSTRDQDLFEPISILCNHLIEEGEPLQSERSGIHCHVCFSNPNLKMLVNSVKLWRYLEDVFYLIGGMGYEFRGVKNDATYCRPLTKRGPIAVPIRGGYYAKSIDLDDLIDSPTTKDFWERWGDLPTQSAAQARYFPVRYHGFNLSPAFSGVRNYKGTAEFRVFNKSLNPFYISAVVRFCKAFIRAAIRSSIIGDVPEEFNTEHSVYDRRPKEAIIDTFVDFASYSCMGQDAISTIITIMQRTPPVEMENTHITSHLRNVSKHWQNSEYSGKIINDLNHIKKPNFIDIHVLRGER